MFSKRTFRSPVPRWRLVTALLLVCLVCGSLVAQWVTRASSATDRSGATDDGAPVTLTASAQSPREGAAESVELPRESWQAASLEIERARRGGFAKSVRLTGKVTQNEDRVAHIYPLVEGAVERVHVQLGQRVSEGELLVVIQSREVGQAKLALYQNRLLHDFAVVKDERRQEVAKNTRELMDAVRENASIEEIQQRFRDRPMGDYRQQLLSAYINLRKSDSDFERLRSLAGSGAVAAKSSLTAESARDLDHATLQAWLEQTEYDLTQEALRSEQAVRESGMRVAVAETNLEILGYDKDDLTDIDPTRQGEAIAHYPIRAPFDGTVVSKDVVLLEHAKPETQILSIADLSSVWITADVYEEHLRLLSDLGGKRLAVHSDAWPDRTFEAEVFYTGEVMDESSRTIRLRARADNAEGLLKPGMFVRVELPRLETPDVLQVPRSAVQEHAGRAFVFVHAGDDTFTRRDVAVGRRSEEGVEITGGLEAGEPVVVSGGFVLKSRLLAHLTEED